MTIIPVGGLNEEERRVILEYYLSRLNKMCKEAGIEEKELRNGGQGRIVSKFRGKIGYYLNRGLGLSLAEIARNLGMGTSVVATAIRKLEHERFIE